jgi:hypothetical protein
MRSLVAVTVFLICPFGADAAQCSAQIARAETVLNQAQPDQQIELPESTAALRHRQPTQESVANAENEAENKLKAALALARRFDSEGKDSECAGVLEEVLRFMR